MRRQLSSIFANESKDGGLPPLVSYHNFSAIFFPVVPFGALSLVRVNRFSAFFFSFQPRWRKLLCALYFSFFLLFPFSFLFFLLASDK